MRDLTPKFTTQRSAAQEFEVPFIAGDRPLGESIGGLSAFSNEFRRGYGDEVFGSNYKGVWLGASEFDNAPLRMQMDGALYAKSATFTNEDGTIFIDSLGLVSTSNFSQSSTTNGSLNQVFSTTSYVDVTGSSGNIVLGRSRLVLFLIKTHAFLTESVGNTGDGAVGLSVNGSTPEYSSLQRFHSGNVQLNTRMSFYLTSLSAGTNTCKLQGRFDTIHAGAPTWTLHSFSWAYLLLGS